ncbi:MAG TPA: tRNA lysidine(34) synthetase TilS [Acidimicrobiia bacterium]|nr:tRNA lysidine(34) synthetase TilS [Acidimicrobiia bacterium]
MSMMNIDIAFNREELVDYANNHDPNPTLTATVFRDYLSQRTLVACSGGADSFALALLCHVYEIDCALAYIEHGLNPASTECERLVKNLAEKLDIPFYCTYLDLSDKAVQSNLEAHAREARYEALEDLRLAHGYDLVATAHHQDDVAETFLINLARGSGSGAASLSARRDALARPLMHWRKLDLMAFISEVGLEYWEDPMNKDVRFVRNRMRNELIPLLNEIAGRDVVPLIGRMARHSQADNEYLQKAASALWPGDVASTRALSELDPAMRAHALRAWITGYPPSENEMERIIDVVEHRRKSVQISGNRTIWRTGAVLYQDVTAQHIPQS